MNILYEDNHIIAVEKKSGIPTQPSPSTKSLQEEVQAFIKERDKKPGNVFLHPIHRLDKSASGIVLFAKSQKALSRLNEEMRNGQIEKEYIALVSGTGEPPHGSLIDYIEHGNHKAILSKNGKKAELVITAKEKENDFWRLHIRLVTGRYHQIRMQLSLRNWPILGDTKYNSAVPFKKDSIALVHNKIAFIHPTKKTRQTIVLDPLPF